MARTTLNSAKTNYSVRAGDQGLAIERRFTREGVHPFDELEWELRDALIGDPAKPAFEQRGVEFPKSWSQNATNIVAQKYFRGQLGTPKREHSVKQMVGRVAGTIAAWGREGGYFASAAAADAFEAELTHILVNQLAAFNSPVWFNVGFEEQPFCSACFILSVEDTMESILAWNTKEGMIFRGGSGSGINLSKIRSSKEQLSKGGYASGPVSFMRGADSWAGTIKSGGKCFKEGTLVATPGGFQPIERIRIGDEVLTHKGTRQVADFVPNGRKQCYRVATSEGYQVEVTEGHKFAYWNDIEGGFDVKPIEAFAPGDSLYALLEPSLGGTTISLLPPEIADPAHATTTVEMQLPTELDEELAYVIGLTYGDGELRTAYPYRLRVAFCKDEAGQVSATRFRDYCRRLFGEEPLLLGDEEGHQQLGFTRKRLIEFLVANGLAKGKGDSLGFPSVLFRAKPEVRAAFIAGVIDADGCYQRRGGWTISSIDRDYLVDLQRLLLSLGIASKIKLSRPEHGTWRALYRLSIVGHTFVDQLAERIATHSAKAQVTYEPSAGADKGWGFRPSLYRPLTARVETRGGFRHVERTVGSTNETSGYGAVAALATHPETVVADYALEVTSCVPLMLESVTATDVAETYDVEVEDVHLLSANGIYSSNTRRAAKMVVLDADHPDIIDFIWCKAREEEKAAALRDAGFDMSIDGEGFFSIQYQNANNSVRVTQEFLEKVERDEDWQTIARVTGEPMETFTARWLMDQMAEAAWRCADPGVQYDTTINDWHTCPNTGRINASNPCSEYLHVDDSACNLASINLLKFLREDGSFDTAAFEHTVDVVFLAQEIVVGFSSYPTEEITRNAKAMRQLGLGYANLGALLMARGLPYDSDEGRSVAAAITALMTGRAYRTSGEVAAAIGPYDEFERNRDPHLRVMRKHRDAAYELEETVDVELLAAARRSWDEAVALGEEFGHRNAQASVLAPTGTISFLMDCDTTGIEPDFSLVKVKELVGGGHMTIVNRTVPRALATLGYAPAQIEQIESYVNDHRTIVGAPGLKDEHLPVFDVAVGERAISHMGHIEMMAAVQPFISGAISKTVNMPADSTVEDIREAYVEGGRLGLKALAIYRDGSKTAQALRTDAQKQKKASTSDEAAEPTPQRNRLPRERESLTHKFSIAGHEGYITAGKYEDGSLGEIFLTDIGKDGSTLRGMMNAFATAISIGLQYGVPLETFVRKFSYMRFDPEGMTTNPEIPFAKSLPDYIMRWLASRFLDPAVHEELGIMSEEVRAKKMAEEASAPGNGANGHANGHADAEAAGDPPAGGDDPQPPTAALTDTPPVVPARIEGLDLGPACSQCGGMMQRTGSCYTCPSCGNNTGCG